MNKEIKIKVNENLIKDLKNSMIAYTDILFALSLGAEVPLKFKILAQLSEEELIERANNLKNFINELEEKYN